MIFGPLFDPFWCYFWVTFGIILELFFGQLLRPLWAIFD